LRSIATVLGLLLAAATAPLALGSNPQAPSEKQIAEAAQAAWENIGIVRALEILDEGIRNHPDGLLLHKLRGDTLATSRHPQDAVRSYDIVLARTPAALDVRWAKWSALMRSGEREESVAELRHIAQVDTRNPLIHLRLAQELRRLDRLEESVEWYKKAVGLAPDLLTWRLGLARARFDVLDYRGAADEVHYVLQKAPPGSPVEIPARNLLAAIMAPMSDRGRRAKAPFSSNVPGEQLKEWSFLRSEAWKLVAAGRYQEAVPLYRNVLALNPKDYVSAYQLGRILMDLDRCEEALTMFETMIQLDPKDEESADAVFRMGQCQMKLKRWQEAYFNFQVLYDAAVEYEESTKHVQLPSGTRVLSKEKLAKWLDRVRPHVPEADRLPSAAPSKGPAMSEEELYAKIAAEPMQPQQPLDARASLMGRDADFSWFRFVIPAGKVVRDDAPTGEHEFIPLAPGDSFPATQKEIYLVFGLLTSSYDAVSLTAQCFLETAELTGEPHAAAQDRVVMSMSDLSGYFTLPPPKTGWAPGLYRCALFEGEKTTAYSQVDEVRFRILAPATAS
jgi:tetratricopeptide (TPR) repeat protein